MNTAYTKEAVPEYLCTIASEAFGVARFWCRLSAGLWFVRGFIVNFILSVDMTCSLCYGLEALDYCSRCLSALVEQPFLWHKLIETIFNIDLSTDWPQDRGVQFGVII